MVNQDSGAHQNSSPPILSRLAPTNFHFIPRPFFRMQMRSNSSFSPVKSTSFRYLFALSSCESYSQKTFVLFSSFFFFFVLFFLPLWHQQVTNKATSNVKCLYLFPQDLGDVLVKWTKGYWKAVLKSLPKRQFSKTILTF